MKHFVNIVIENDGINENRDIAVDAVIQTANIGLNENALEYEMYESENNTQVLSIPVSKNLNEAQQAFFAKRLANKLFDKGYTKFDIEFSVNEAALNEAAPTTFTPTHYGGPGGLNNVMLHTDGNLYLQKQRDDGQPGREIVRWNGNPTGEGFFGKWNPATIKGTIVNGQRVPYPAGTNFSNAPRAAAPAASPAAAAPASRVSNTTPTGGLLRRGNRGEEVKQLQRDLGMTGNEIDGIFGPATERAVRTFQQNSGAKVDGLVGPETRAAIEKYQAPEDNSAPAQTPPETTDIRGQDAAPDATDPIDDQTNPPADAVDAAPGASQADEVPDTAADEVPDTAPEKIVVTTQDQANSIFQNPDSTDAERQAAREFYGATPDAGTDAATDDGGDATGNVEPRPASNGGRNNLQVNWDRKYSSTHNRDGSPIATGTDGEVATDADASDATDNGAAVGQADADAGTAEFNPDGTVNGPGQNARPGGRAAPDADEVPNQQDQNNVSSSNVGPRPTDNDDVFGQNDWDIKYADTHNTDGTPKTPARTPGDATDDGGLGQRGGATGTDDGATGGDSEVNRKAPEQPVVPDAETPLNIDTTNPVDPQIAKDAAGEFYQAMKGGTGVGTDEPAIQSQLKNIKSADEFVAAEAAYREEYNGRSLIGDLYDEMNQRDLDRFVMPEFERLGLQLPTRDEAETGAGVKIIQNNESVEPMPKGAFMVEDRAIWRSLYESTHYTNGKPRPRTFISESKRAIPEITFEDDDKFFENYGVMWFNEDEMIDEAEYQGRTVKLGKPMAGDVKKFKVYVKNPKGNVVKVNFGQKGARIKKDNPERRRSFRARHNCDNPGPRHKARYWSCRKW